MSFTSTTAIIAYLYSDAKISGSNLFYSFVPSENNENYTLLSKVYFYLPYDVTMNLDHRNEPIFSIEIDGNPLILSVRSNAGQLMFLGERTYFIDDTDSAMETIITIKIIPKIIEMTESEIKENFTVLDYNNLTQSIEEMNDHIIQIREINNKDSEYEHINKYLNNEYTEYDNNAFKCNEDLYKMIRLKKQNGTYTDWLPIAAVWEIGIHKNNDSFSIYLSMDDLFRDCVIKTCDQNSVWEETITINNKELMNEYRIELEKYFNIEIYEEDEV